MLPGLSLLHHHSRHGALRRRCAALAPARRWWHATLLLCALGPHASLGAQPALRNTPPRTDAWVRRLLDRRDGLPEVQVNAIERTADGYFWLGTRRGLVRYDGLRYTLFAPANTPALPSPWINGIRADQRGRLWLATGGGLVVRDGATFRLVDTTQVPAADVWATLEDRRGTIWVATESGVFRGDGTRFQPVPGARGFTYSLAQDGRGRVWMAGRNTLAYADGDSVVSLHQRFGISGRVFTVFADGPDHLWYGTTAGITEVRLDASGSPAVVRRISTAAGRNDRPVWSIGRGPDSTLWLGTETGGTLRLIGNRLEPMSDAAVETWSIYADPHGILWAGTSSGLERYQRSAFTTLSDGLPDSQVWSARIAPWGQLWTSLADGAVYAWQGNRFSRVTPPGAIEQSSPIWASPTGMLVGAESRTLQHIDADGRRTTLASADARIGSLLGLLDAGSDVWISADSGLFRLRNGQLQPMNAQLGRQQILRPRDMARDSAGRLYFGRPGVTIADGNTARFIGTAEGLTSTNVRAIVPRGDFVWIGTPDSGLYVLHRDTVRALGAIDPRLKGEVLALGDDHDGYLWVNWSYGLRRIPFADLEAAARGQPRPVHVRSFDQSDGLPAGSFRADFQSRLARDSAGALYVANARGVVRIEPSAITPDTVPPPVVVEGISVGGAAVDVGPTLALAPGLGRIEFTLATPGAMRPTEVRLQYRLIGVDSAWNDAGSRRTMAFGPLRGGAYRLEARTATEDGDWSPVRSLVAFDVGLRPTEAPWFVPLLVLATGALVLAGTRARRAALERRGQALALEVRERTADLEAARATLERRVSERTAQLAGELAERERLQQALNDAQKLEGLGRLAGGVAHEINNGMASVLGFTELAAIAARGHDDILSDLNEVRRAGDRVKTIVRQLMLFARREQMARTLIDVGDTVGELTRTLRELAGARVRVEVEIAPALRAVQANAQQLEQVVVNLVMNARDAMPDGGVVMVRVGARTLDAPTALGGVDLGAGEYVCITVSDTGVGMTESVRSRLFEPFFTTKAFAGGTGLGLAMAHGIVREHGGTIVVSSDEGHGSTFDIWLPADMSDAAPRTTPRRTPGDGVLSDRVTPSGPFAAVRTPMESSHETILLVDDDDSVREAVQRLLEVRGYRVLPAAGAQAALAVADEDYDGVDLVLTDFKMPELDGLTLVRMLRERHGSRPTVFMTGFAGYAPVDIDELATFGPIVSKPISARELQATLRSVLDAAQRSAHAE
jgi:signal transduction histidine kinase/ligand-binding sensor domain-containing protein/CheY-like chemotaxis protein